MSPISSTSRPRPAGARWGRLPPSPASRSTPTSKPLPGRRLQCPETRPPSGRRFSDNESRRQLLHPEGHRSLEQIALLAQQRELGAQLGQVGPLVGAQPTPADRLRRSLGDPVPSVPAFTPIARPISAIARPWSPSPLHHTGTQAETSDGRPLGRFLLDMDFLPYDVSAERGDAHITGKSIGNSPVLTGYVPRTSGGPPHRNRRTSRR